MDFFEAGHGKVDHDGAGACVKRALVKEKLKISAAELLDVRSHVPTTTIELVGYVNPSSYVIGCASFCLPLTQFSNQ